MSTNVEALATTKLPIEKVQLLNQYFNITYIIGGRGPA